MESNDIKFTIDPNGNVHREIVERPQPQPKRPKLLKRLASAFSFHTA